MRTPDLEVPNDDTLKLMIEAEVIRICVVEQDYDYNENDVRTKLALVSERVEAVNGEPLFAFEVNQAKRWIKANLEKGDGVRAFVRFNTDLAAANFRDAHGDLLMAEDWMEKYARSPT